MKAYFYSKQLVHRNPFIVTIPDHNNDTELYHKQLQQAVNDIRQQHGCGIIRDTYLQSICEITDNDYIWG